MVLDPVKNIRVNGRFLFKSASKVAKEIQESETLKEPPKEEFKIPEQKSDDIFRKFSLENDPPYISSTDSVGQNINYLA